MKPTINSDKHYIHSAVFTTVSAARTILKLVTVDNALGVPADVRVGALVKAVYVEYWVDSATASKTVNAAIVKLPGGASAPTYAEMQNLSTYANKKNVLEFHQGLAPSGGNTIPLFRQWVLIPKGKQRFGLGDEIVFVISATGATMNTCGFATFKEYY